LIINLVIFTLQIKEIIMFSAPPPKKPIPVLKEEIERLLVPFKDKEGEIDYDLLSKNENAFLVYRELTYHLHQQESAVILAAKEKSLAEKKPSEPPINYIWIGPPAQIPGQDIGGPIEMAKVNQENPITFWCLEEQKSYYIDKFKEYKNITIHSLETHLREKQDPESKISNDAKLMQKLLDTCLKEAGRGSIRDRVTVKDAFSLFLLHSIGGYILDTNVLPLKEDKLSLKSYDKVGFPCLKKPVLLPCDLECWLMFSPNPMHEQAKLLFSGYYSLWLESENLRKTLSDKNKSLKEYYDFMGKPIMRPILDVYQRYKCHLFDAKPHKHNYYTDIPDLGLRKTYNNTHVFVPQKNKYDPKLFDSKNQDQDERPSEIFFLVYSRNIVQLKVFIASGGNVNEQIKTPLENLIDAGETPLHLAIRTKALKEVIQLLLESGAEPDLAITYQNKTLPTARELTQLAAHSKYADIINTFEKNQNKTSPAPN
jgi:hypothetical protein